MNTYTQNVWEIIGEALFDDTTLAEDLEKLLSKDYRLFLSEEQASQVSTHTVKEYFLERLTQWYEWLPNTTINLIGGELAQEAFKTVEWHLLVGEIGEHFEREKSHADQSR